MIGLGNDRNKRNLDPRKFGSFGLCWDIEPDSREFY